MGWIGCVHCEKLWCDFVARISSLIALVQHVLHRVSCSNKKIENAPTYYKTNQYMILGSNGVVRVRSLRKIPMRLCGTNFCTSLARFAPSFVRPPNSLECTKIVQNAPKCQFRVQSGGSGAFVAKNSDATSWHELLHLFGPFCNEFCKATKQSRMHPNSTNTPKRQYIVQWGGSGAFIAKCSTWLCFTNFCTSSARFAPSFIRQPSGPECTQIVWNALEH